MIGTSIRLRLLCQRLPALRRTFHSNAPFVINPNRLQMQSSILQRLKRLEPLQIAQLRLINTTDKNKDHHQSIDVFDPEFLGKKKPSGPKTAQEFADVNSQKNWISYGFDETDPIEDKHLYNFAFFTLYTLGCVTFLYFLYYFPDFILEDWSLREAFLELDRREALGLPLIDPNLVDPSKIQLPTDEELGGYRVYT
ncbi:hypothetical protein RDWZM_002037 [Blomia tropicalis]|uniref:NADH dehydrogenase [ubiquinone] 1 beta subcomplex subunit 11, mitochondrial n=1 Tax=Blomia tropicalis TaxID=40697 RepID=A0A9Q0MDA4_BLOTA|nr:NADH dehydrogenase 1 beta subcomplex subunit 11 ndufb11 [Blomia tropicalis]KAJ6223492.1 hypothetical protein RDWZM_002037 [Blomia tropicalis]